MKHNCLHSITQQGNVIQVCESSNKCDNSNFYLTGMCRDFFLPQADRGNKKKSNSIFNEYYAVYHWHCRSSDKNILE